MTITKRAAIALLLTGLVALPGNAAGSTLPGATRTFYTALNAVLDGHAAPMFKVWSHARDVTYMSPFGQLLVGWKPIRASWVQQANSHLGGRVEPSDLHYFRSSTLGVVVGFERGHVTINGKKTRVDIRATSTYRLEHGRWRMIGHHTDPLS